MDTVTSAAASMNTQPMKPVIVPNDESNCQPIQAGPAYLGHARQQPAASMSMAIWPVGEQAHLFHNLLIDCVGRAGCSIILEMEDGQNTVLAPVAGYRMTYSRIGCEPGYTRVTCTVDLAACQGAAAGARSLTYHYRLAGRVDHPKDGYWEGAGRSRAAAGRVRNVACHSSTCPV